MQTLRSWMSKTGSLLVVLLLVAACGSDDDATNRQRSREPLAGKLPPKEAVTGTGRELAAVYCQQCHALPRPELLDTETWKDIVLPKMGRRLGVYDGGERPDSLYPEGLAGTLLREANIYPPEPLLARENWSKIVDYYVETSPTNLPSPSTASEIEVGLDGFQLRTPSFRTDPPMTTMVRALGPSRLFLGDAKGLLTILGDAYQERFTMGIPSAPAAMHPVGSSYLVTLMGSVPPTDLPSGRIIELALRLRTKQYKYVTVIDSLHRPVYTARADLNNDDRQDLVVSEFGSHLGSLSWFEKRSGEGYERHVLQEKPGAIRSVVRDFTEDGLDDILALVAQGDEGIYLFRNQGGGSFQEGRLLQFPPSYGSTHFELADFNGDGAEDIIYVAGDNADYPPVMKPYHGIRIYINNGENTFEKRYFFHLNGAYDATAHDFDGDGDLDIAAISFFPNYEGRPEESFVYLENTGGLAFDAHTFPNSVMGRWLALDKGDTDGDGDIGPRIGILLSSSVGHVLRAQAASQMVDAKGPSSGCSRKYKGFGVIPIAPREPVVVGVRWK